MMRRAFVLLFVLFGTVWTSPVAAHDVRKEAVFLDVGESAVAVELLLPLFQLRAAAPELFERGDLSRVDTTRARAYVGTHLTAFDRRRRTFLTVVESAERKVLDGDEVLQVNATLHAPSGSDGRWLELRDDTILDTVVTHSAMVFLRRDVRSDPSGDHPILVGELHHTGRTLVVDRTGGSRWSTMATAFGLGWRHIAEGTDHLVFLLLLLVACATASGTRAIALALARLVTAFTVGHAITLAASTWWHFGSSAVVEVLVALTVLITAVHVVRPLFPRREAFVAAAFGIVHGLAFASALEPFGFDRTTLVSTLLGFNLGVEAMQLTIVLVTTPLLALLAQGPSHRFVRYAAATAGAVFALGWIVERTFGLQLATSAIADRLATRGPWLLVALGVMVLVDRGQSTVAPLRSSSSPWP